MQLSSDETVDTKTTTELFNLIIQEQRRKSILKLRADYYYRSRFLPLIWLLQALFDSFRLFKREN